MNPNRPIAKSILKNKEQYSPEEFVGQVYSVSGDPRLVSRAIPLGERYVTAFQLLINILSTSAPPFTPARVKKPGPKVAEVFPEVKEKGPPLAKEETVPDFYQVLGVSETASKEEIKRAHRALIKKYHPDVYAGKGLSDEEMNKIKEYAQEINLAYLTLSKEADRKDYNEARKRYSARPPNPPPPSPPSATGEPLQEKSPGKVVITFKPTAEKRPETDKALAKTSKFRQLVTDAGAVTLDAETVAQLKQEGVLPEEFKGPELTTALLVLKSGGESEYLFEKIREADFLTNKERESLFVTADILENIQAAEPQLTLNLQAAYQYPQIIIERAPPEVTAPQKNQILLTVKDYILSPVVKRGAKLAKGKAKKFASKAAKKGAKKLAKTAARKVAAEGTKVAAKLVAGELISDAIAALGLATGPLAPIVVPLLKALAWVATWLAEKVISKIVNFIRKHKEDIALVLVGVGLLMGSPLLIGAGFLATGLAGPAIVVGRAAALVSSLFAIFTALLIPSIAVPLIISLLVTALAVALITFIINSGAYVVPFAPSITTPGAVESPFIGIEKVASPPGPFSNPPPSISVDYTITITAKLGTLTNITFLYDCRVVGEGAGTPCPSPSPSIPDPPGFISPVEPFVITYRIIYDSRYRNSVVVDTFTVTADAPGQPGATAATSASVVIGDPPIDCPIPGGYITWGSYIPGDESSRLHGNNRYWAQTGVPSCSWGLPQRVCYGPNQPEASGNVCYNRSGSCSFYGYAIDVQGGKDVLAPQVGGASVTWSCSYGFPNGGGTAGHTYICTSGPYRLVLTHLRDNARTGGGIRSGEKIGELYPNPNHLHIEFAVSGVYQRPEDFFCR